MQILKKERPVFGGAKIGILNKVKGGMAEGRKGYFISQVSICFPSILPIRISPFLTGPTPAGVPV